ncbi:FAD:protein FMN transferase [Ferriphaselus sp. R-1]|uniref:FAD:protein FMN transferase n=1 Tax=Ferriphaselus sp. R-1 TaxID=1485544 RepID=UPI0005550450|nr:FAD:protein FMN transferase [Ferriphaselus sp. R-1]
MRFVVSLLLALLLTACGKEPLYQEQGYVFGTLVEVSVYGAEEPKAKSAVAAVMQEFQRLNDLLHAWKPSSLSELNTALARGESHEVTPELAAMLQEATALSQRSGGTFNPAIGGLVKLWGFQADEFQAALPDERQVAALVAANPQMSDLSFQPTPAGDAVRVSSRNPAVQFDLGGYAKGYALDRAIALLKQQGIHHALVNIGGNVMALGQHGSRPWRVGIQHPRKPAPIATLELRDGEAIGTSGDYQRYFEFGGKRYCHLIDPRTGHPAQGVQAVTILTHGDHAGLLSDAASKPLFLAGAAAWVKAAHTMGLDEAMLIDGDGHVQVTAAMQKRLEFTDKGTVRKSAPQ